MTVYPSGMMPHDFWDRVAKEVAKIVAARGMGPPMYGPNTVGLMNLSQQMNHPLANQQAAAQSNLQSAMSRHNAVTQDEGCCD